MDAPRLLVMCENVVREHTNPHTSLLPEVVMGGSPTHDDDSPVAVGADLRPPRSDKRKFYRVTIVIPLG